MVGKKYLSLIPWKVLGTVVAAGWGSVVTAASLPPQWAFLCFVVSYMAFLLAGLGIIAKWGKSDFLTEKCRDIWQKQLKTGSSRAGAVTRTALWRFAPSVFLVGLTAIALFITRTAQEDYELAQQEGVLYPANDPMPTDACSNLGNDQIAIFTGITAMVPDSFPYVVLKDKGKDRLIVNRMKDGAIRVSVEVFDARDILIAKIEDGRFKVDRSHLWDFKRKDWNTLEAIDFQGKPILKMRYLNKQAITIDATLRYPDLKDPVIMNGSGISTGKIRLATRCLSGGTGGIAIE